METVEVCEKADMRVIIIDSISQEWEGSGGIIETNGNMAGNSFTNWNRVMSLPDLFNRVFHLLARYDAERQLDKLEKLSDYSLTEHQFAQLIGRSRLYNYLPIPQKKDIEKLPLSDTQVSIVARDYYQDRPFCRSDCGDINLRKV